MTTATANYVCDNSSLANFKSWAQAISNFFTTAGWTQTTDTGQVNWGSIASVPSSTYVYEVWKASDALASTMPIFVKVWYGFSSSSPRCEITVGTSSDGAGNITGQVVTGAPWLWTGQLANNGATTYSCYFSGSTGEIRVYMWGTSSGTPIISCFFVIERSKDSSGNNTADYVTVVCSAMTGVTSPSRFQQTIFPATVGNQDTGVITVAGTSGSNTGAFGGTVAGLPVFPLIGKVGNPMLGLMTVYSNDAAGNTTVTATSMYGSTHTYIAMNPAGGLSTTFGLRNLNGAVMAGLMRYE